MSPLVASLIEGYRYINNTMDANMPNQSKRPETALCCRSCEVQYKIEHRNLKKKWDKSITFSFRYHFFHVDMET